MPSRRALLASLGMMPAAARAQPTPWPIRPVRVIIPFAPGGSSDIAARLMAPRVAALLGQNLVIENRGGGGGNIAGEAVLRAGADGYTLLQGNMGLMAVNPSLFPVMPFDPLADFAPVSHIVSVANMLVVPVGRPWTDLAGLLGALRAQPETLRAGTSGNGSIGHLAQLLLDQMAGTRSVSVPYRGGGPMVNDLLAGHLDYGFATLPTILGGIEGGLLRPIAIGTATRSPLFPQVPTVAEAGLPGFEVANWDSWLFPGGTPRPIVERMAAVLREVLAEPAIIAEFARRGLEAQSSSPEVLHAAIRTETLRWGPLVRASGATPG
ncbi:Bug family tripartite tricarboxylate transporter substrate binding protein [Plastoroseomonas arctica]|uniref:Tripartite tricarboxylate transporter substrate binding protein n=1 Tax=Plastoroseomonas arctica TaxID=1509237 RepID=A0AAF1KQA3_9PROT|nr:tripartite tricarboxylate transporter substrate-binding protein [Plastoroseomonas arctica]MBR0657313.1 tripartite tricarboxylate transporter substrate binding protein [Plastoroseomonas arctica]